MRDAGCLLEPGQTNGWLEAEDTGQPRCSALPGWNPASTAPITDEEVLELAARLLGLRDCLRTDVINSILAVAIEKLKIRRGRAAFNTGLPAPGSKRIRCQL